MAGAQLFELSKDAFAKVAYRERPDGLLAVEVVPLLVTAADARSAGRPAVCAA